MLTVKKIIFFYPLQEMALHVLLNVTGSTECIDDIAANHVLVNVLHVLYTLPQHRTVALDLLHAISGDTRLVKECLQFGKLVDLGRNWLKLDKTG